MMTKPRRNADIETTTLPDGHVVLVNKKTNWAYTISPLGALVWEFCDGKNSQEDIKKCLLDVPGIESRPEIDAEVAQLLAVFSDEGFTENCDDSAI